MKHCSKCGQEKPLKDFTKDRTRKDGHHSYCRECNRRFQKGPYLKHMYGITLEEYSVMLKEQEGACKICRQECFSALSVDHCHDTGKVRGLLCRRCNSGLGYFQDDPKLLARAINYLNEIVT